MKGHAIQSHFGWMLQSGGVSVDLLQVRFVKSAEDAANVCVCALAAW